MLLWILAVLLNENPANQGDSEGETGLLIDVLLLYQGHRAIGETEASQKWL